MNGERFEEVSIHLKGPQEAFVPLMTSRRLP